MTALDWSILTGYLLAVMAIGLWFSGRNRTYAHFMFGAGRMPWAAVGLSLIATSVSATTFLGNPADSFATDMTYLMCNLGAAIGVVVVSWVFIPRFRNAGIQSAYELLETRFSSAVRRLAAGIYCLHLLMRTGILMFGPSLVLSKILGVSAVTAIAMTSVLAIGYTLTGGIQAVIWTDVLQFVTLVGGGAAALVVASRSSGGFGNLVEMASEAGKTKWLDFSLDPGNARTLLSAGIVYGVFEIAIRGCDQQFVQRYLSVRSTRAAVYSSVLSVVCGLGIGVLFFWVGAALFVHYRVLEAAPLPDTMGINEVFPHFLVQGLPAGLTGILVAAILAAAMSSLDSAMTALSNTSAVDFRRRDAKHAGGLVRARVGVVVWGLLGACAAVLTATTDRSLLGTALYFTSLFTGPLLGLFVLAFYFPRTRPSAVVAGAVCGMASLVAFTTPPFLAHTGWTPVYSFSWPWNPLISLTGTLGFAGAANALLSLTRGRTA